jgi:hypothetical protein
MGRRERKLLELVRDRPQSRIPISCYIVQIYRYVSTGDMANLADSQGVLIGMGLYMIDQTFCGPASDATPATTPNSPPHKRLRQQSMDSDVSDPPAASRGTGYAGHGIEDVCLLL